MFDRREQEFPFSADEPELWQVTVGKSALVVKLRNSFGGRIFSWNCLLLLGGTKSPFLSR